MWHTKLLFKMVCHNSLSDRTSIVSHTDGIQKRIVCDAMLKVADDIMLHISLIMKMFDERLSGKEHLS